ncbi:glycosyltransferase family 9 protein [Capillimicrobium parvum]|uniref:Lipopolysaccharide heptosyltransferase 1 n=1 Tax=Capillimicrobium parvum TaxID=2884022 RepID=A0A9E7BZV9_9ACTN|nr:glycosyltransferase family 9 protein [Capillimicrobium parvum]UGS35775.1 Lipopolysaccharide heptosyltransferase 1 [Capillimicrobium parvum]
MTGHVLAARCDSLGDVLLTGPALRALRAGAGRLTLLCGPRGRAAAELLPAVDAVRTWHTPWIDAEPKPVDPAAVDELVAWARAEGFDHAVIFTSFHQSPLPLALLLRLAGVPRISAISVDFPGSLLDLRHRVGDDVHEVQRALSLAHAAGFALPGGDVGRLRVRRPGAAPPVAGPYVVVHPGTSVPARAWAPEHHRALVIRLAAQGRSVVVTGAADERALTASVAGDDALDLGGALSLPQLADVLAGADAVVVGNTGPAHLAAAVGTPVVSLFAPTVPAARWRPWAVPHELLGIEVPCAGCRARECHAPGHPCLDDLTPDAVADALERLAPAIDREEVWA